MKDFSWKLRVSEIMSVFHKSQDISFIYLMCVTVWLIGVASLVKKIFRLFKEMWISGNLFSFFRLIFKFRNFNLSFLNWHYQKALLISFQALSFFRCDYFTIKTNVSFCEADFVSNFWRKKHLIWGELTGETNLWPTTFVVMDLIDFTFFN